MATPEDLIGLRMLYMGFTAARVVLTANNLGIFDRLEIPSTAGELAGGLKTDRRATEILLDALTGIGLTTKGRDGRYRNSAVSGRYLVKGGRLYQGDIVRHASSMWDSFSALDDVVRMGKPARRGRDHEAFIMGMHNLTVLRSGRLIRAVGLRGVKTMLDLGGGPGTNAMAFSKKGVRATIFDLPQTIAIARRVARREGVKGLSFISGDFHVDGIGSGYDLILISQIFHAFSPEENLALLAKCRTALNPGGRVVIQEFPIKDNMTSPPQSALFSINMLVGTESGRCYTPREIKKWLRQSGFADITVKDLAETVLVEGKVKVPRRR
ncbi:MAG: methyltransferase domain-containing protein [Nitrospirae bacterium]|nr:methyltransferase domain-containing protein [Nitrospirota bacterium]